MQYRTLGKTGLRISEVGFGTWQLANDPHIWVGSDLNESLRCLAKYVELGGNFIDTAWIYGYDDAQPNRHPSEELIGKYLKESKNRDKVVLASKVPPKNMHWPAEPEDTLEDCFPVEHIKKCVDDSLRSLGVETIDLMQFHVWNDSWTNQDTWKETIQEIMKSGKVKHWGISVNDYQPTNCIKALDTGLISTIQFIFNLFHQEPTKELLPYAKANNIGLIARVPLDEGGLSGKYTTQTVFPEGDFRNSYFSPDRLVELVSRTDALKQLFDGEVESLSEMALRYILSFDAVSTVIPGMRKMEHVLSNTLVSDKGSLSHNLMDKLKQHAWERNFYGEETSTI